MNLPRSASLLLGLALVACAREDVGPSLTPDIATVEAGTALASPPSWILGARPAEGLACYLDLVEGATRESGGWSFTGAGNMRILGWSVETTGQQATQRAVYVVLSSPGHAYVFTGTRNDRPDVAAAPQFEKLAPRLAGVTADVAGSALPPGVYAMSFVVGDSGQAGSCALGEANTITVR
ncbi:hypothetical protein QLQ15_07385 [Lysobacter sp. LF1]|uniref:Lipoprotein n=1 Tax=Lysobacter stagni TaxID=3045172 RepID=A0ABT6XF07_9GAMM|nr:hypothetical protein [Lysobacter sp. LF1]MDI9238736.1 hypothetical protein [Lysobacter sp. LF1]